MQNPFLNYVEKKRWVGHKRKKPMNPKTGELARVSDSQTWGTYEEVQDGKKKYSFDGIGIVLGKLPGEELMLAGIDMDHVIRTDGTLEPFAQEIVSEMNSYTEISPSGGGLHILCLVKCSEVGRKKGMGNGCKLEMYNHGRYFTVTENSYGEEGSKPISERTEEFLRVHDKYFGVKQKEVSEVREELRREKKSDDESQFNAKECAKLKVESDEALLEKMFSSEKGERIRSLFNGDVSEYPSRSEADLALCAYLSYWTDGDANRMDRLFRLSGLMREKWEREDYREETIKRATESQINAVETSNSSLSREKTNELVTLHGMSTAYYLRNYFGNDSEKFREYSHRETGYKNLDLKQKLYPGLYVLGAISSLGKTTFCHQLGDQLAQKGEHVLYFSLEQSAFELASKGLSRYMRVNQLKKSEYQDENSAYMSSFEIKEGGLDNKLVRSAIQGYLQQTEHLIVYECKFNTMSESIQQAVKNYMEHEGIKPIVIVDYLQILPTMDKRQTLKDAVDGNVRAFKKLQMENDLVVLLISSLNRSNYLTPVDYESFKESGGIEYTADVIWGLQLSVMNDEVFCKEKSSLKEKREKVREAKQAIPRKIELLCLKSRYGLSGYKCEFDYYAQNDYFVPINYREDTPKQRVRTLPSSSVFLRF